MHPRWSIAVPLISCAVTLISTDCFDGAGRSIDSPIRRIVDLSCAGMANAPSDLTWAPYLRRRMDIEARVPSELAEIDEVQTRKHIFFTAVLPAVLQVNESIRDTRRRLSAISGCREDGWPQAEPVNEWLATMARRYRAPADPDALLAKVGEIPPALALAQAAVESGYGTSRGAQDDNALFGQFAMVGETPRPDVMAPTRKPTVRLASFDSVLAATWSYADNLNSHPAYAQFRALRREMSETGEPIDAIKLATTLKTYSQRKEKYVQDIRAVIRKNRLDDLAKTYVAETTEVAMRE
jgi:Bax protein